MQVAYYESTRRLSRRHLQLGVPSIVLGTLAGTSVIASLTKLPFRPEDLLWIQFSAGFLTVVAAVLSALQTFLKLSEEAEKHRVAAARFASLKHHIELLLAFLPEGEASFRSDLKAIEETWNKIRQESPNLSSQLWRKIEDTFEPEDILHNTSTEA